MKLISNRLDLHAVERIAERHGVTVYQGDERTRRDGRQEISFLLRPVSGSDERRAIKQCSYTNSGERRAFAVCWHGHYVVMRDIFSEDEDAVLRTAMANYNGRAGFEQNAWPTGAKNIGSLIAPQTYESACHCEDADELANEAQRAAIGEPLEHHVRFGTLHSDGTLTQERTIAQTAIQRCPFFIFMPEHYRTNGTCRCDDPEHTEMAEWGYSWDESNERWIGVPDREELT